MNPNTQAGRSCPLHYRYAPEVFQSAATAPFDDLEVLYVAGGLYGNEHAVDAILDLFEQEQGRKCLVFNGDFHWFDVDPAVFARVQAKVLAHTALRGNVETELANPNFNAEVGCGCAYPAWVDDTVVERSNRIMGRLANAINAQQQQALAALPMWLRANVGPLRVGIVHGDAQSLSGWGFSQECLADDAHIQTVAQWFDKAHVDAFACSHTCLPVYQAIKVLEQGVRGWVLNNGSAGMPNYKGQTAAHLTRIATRPCLHPNAIHAGVEQGVFFDAVPIEMDVAQSTKAFLAQWPKGSDAHRSYFKRIAEGPSYTVQQAMRGHGI